MNILRVSKVIVCLSLSIFALMVGFNNLADYGSNYSFVQHTLSMDTVFSGNTLKSRAILNPLIWNIAYGLIIFAELLTGVLLMVGTICLIKNLNNSIKFIRAKSWIYLGCSIGIFLWFFGFIVIGGKWFCMWQSAQWNGIEAAFRFVVLIMLTIIITAIPESGKEKP